jgi:hypothetical protein
VTRILICALGAGLSPVVIIYGLGSYLLQRQPDAPALPLSPNTGLLLGLGALAAFAACVWGLHLGVQARLRQRAAAPPPGESNT